jgi:hypothetical protein
MRDRRTHSSTNRRAAARSTRILAATASLSLLSCLASPAAAVATESLPAPVSPGAPDRFAGAAGSCPTFTWATTPSAAGYELVLFRLAEDGALADPEPAIRVVLPAGSSAWTPPRGDCLSEAGRYAWSVRDVASDQWPDALLLELAEPDGLQAREALDLLRRYVERGGSLDSLDEIAGLARASSITVAEARAFAGKSASRTGATDEPRKPQHLGELADRKAQESNVSAAKLALSGDVAAKLWANEWRLDHASEQFFDFTNPSGDFTLRVQGQEVLTGATAGDITQVNAGAGLTGGGISGAVSLAADFAGSGSANQVARSDHDHATQTWSVNALDGLRVNNATSIGNSAGLRGLMSSPTGFTYGLWGESASDGGRGVGGWATSTTGAAFGVFGDSVSPDGVGVLGRGRAATGSAFGVQGTTASTSGTAVFGTALAGSGQTMGVRGHTWSPNGVGGVFTSTGGGLLIAADNVSFPNFSDLEFVVDAQGNVTAESYAGDGSKLDKIATSLFGKFGGDGSDGALHLTSGTITLGSFGTVTRRQYTNLTIESGATLTSGAHINLIAVQGRCTIRGLVNVDGRGALGPLGSSGLGQDGASGRLKHGSFAGGSGAHAPVPGCVTGAGGGGGGTIFDGGAGAYSGGFGGGAEGQGGLQGGGVGGPGPTDMFWRATISHAPDAGYPSFPLGSTVTDGFDDLLTCVGASGGRGAGTDTISGGGGGNGGGVIYLECGELDFPGSGTISARGTNGALGAGGGGGGGGGGVALVRTLEIVSQSGVIRATGGTGSSAGSCQSGGSCFAGGAGAPGYVDIVEIP